MQRAVLGWILVGGCLVVLGVGTLIAARTLSRAMPPAMTEQWRQYAADVEQGTRTPSASITRTLTEAAIAQNAYANSAVRLVRLVGAGVLILGLVLTLDLIRWRLRHGASPPADGGS